MSVKDEKDKQFIYIKLIDNVSNIIMACVSRLSQEDGEVIFALLAIIGALLLCYFAWLDKEHIVISFSIYLVFLIVGFVVILVVKQKKKG